VTRRPLVALLAAAFLAPAGLAGPATPATAQVAIECPAPASPAAAAASAPAATPAAAPAEVAFPEGGGDLTVFAAASLTEAFEEIAAELEATNPGLAVTLNFGGSQALVTQIEQGAEADVFASANFAQMEAAKENGSIAGEPVVFVRNKLAIVVPTANPGGIGDPADLAADGVRLVLANPDVPVGRYAREALCLMGADPVAYGEGFVEAVAANIVSEEEDVRDVLAKVELGEADAGIVYVSDALVGAEAVSQIEIPEDVNLIAAYPIAAVAGGDAALAEAFIAYVLSPEGQGVLTGFGFEPAG
jgi:molybdate transport system substrate-binding protein